MAPLKLLAVPKLELQAAVLAVGLANTIVVMETVPLSRRWVRTTVLCIGFHPYLSSDQ